MEVITAENIRRMRETLPRDQSAEIEIGCVTWQFGWENFVGHITVWPNGRGAVCWNGTSAWGDWDWDCNMLKLDDESLWVTADGRIVDVD